MPPLSLNTAWSIAERSLVPADAPAARRIDTQVAFYMGVHAALSAQLQAVVADDPAAHDVLLILDDEVKTFFELFALPVSVAN